MIEIHDYTPDNEKFQAILRRGETQDDDVRGCVDEIVRTVRDGGDAAVFDYSARFDGVSLTAETVRVSEAEFEAARAGVDDAFLTASALARVNIRRFHEYQRRESYLHEDGDGVRLSKRVMPLKRVGVCCPAKSAPLFSSMLMNVIPAQIAGVPEIYAVVPPRADGTIDPHILTIAKMLEVDAVYRVGGAHAVAALAYGTESITRVDKIVGPGNAYVAMAKRQVFGQCGIDSVAGPSEIVVIADRLAKAEYVAADLLSQLEHGSGYEAGVLFTDSKDLAAGVKLALQEQLAALERREMMTQALERNCAIFLCRNLYEAVDAANLLAPEHLEIIAVEQEHLLAEVENAGAVFLGAFSAEPVGDYFAGTNHVLPTGGAARYSSSLSVYDFLKDISVIEYTGTRLKKTAPHIIHMAELERLGAHANAIRIRQDDLTAND